MPMHPIPPKTMATNVIVPGKNVTRSKNKNPRMIEHKAEYSMALYAFTKRYFSLSFEFCSMVCLSF